MKSNVLALIAVGFIGTMSLVARAMPITYDLNFTNGTDTLTGSITTDGTIGGIFEANIVAWWFTDTGPAAFNMSSAGTNFIQCQGAGGCFTASPSTLTFDFLSTTPLDPHALFLATSTPLQGVVNFFDAGDCPPVGCITVLSFTTSLQNFWFVDGPPNGVVAAVTTTVPEPGTLALLAIGLGGLGFSRRRQ